MILFALLFKSVHINIFILIKKETISMPCITIKTNQSLENEQQLDCCHSISEKTAHLLGKPESYVMALLDTQVSMTMSGTIEPADTLN